MVMKIGDKIVVTEEGINSAFYSKGDTGVIKEIDGDRHLWVLFEGQEKPRSNSSRNGKPIWCIALSMCRKVA